MPTPVESKNPKIASGPIVRPRNRSPSGKFREERCSGDCNGRKENGGLCECNFDCCVCGGLRVPR